MRKRYCHSGTGGMVSSSSLFLVSRALLQMFMISLLLYDGSVWCAIVGNGKHEMENEKITKLKMGTPTKCKIQQTADGFELLYDKDETAKETCALDLFMKKIDTFIMMKVGVRAKSGTLASCLTGDKNLEDRVNDNILPFSFSLHESSEFKLSESGDADCNHLAQCKNNGGNCLSEAHYSVGFGRNGNKVTNYISPIGDTQLWSCDYPEKSADANDAHIEFKVRTDGQAGWEINGGCKDDLAFGKKSPNCVIPKKLQQAKKWEIKDKSLPDPIFDHLFTLHVFKQQGVPKHKKGPGLGDKLTGGQTPKCQLYIHFDGKYFKQLGGTAPPPPSTETDTNSSSSSGGATNPPLISEGPAAESSNIGLIIGIVAVVVVLLLVVGGAVWFFAFRGKGGEEAGMEMGMTAGAGGTTKTKATKAGTTVGATQAKTGMTTVGGTQAKTGMTTAGGATKGATSKAAGTTKGGATSKAGATSKK